MWRQQAAANSRFFRSLGQPLLSSNNTIVRGSVQLFHSSSVMGCTLTLYRESSR
jgi:hypothetical protein